MRNAPARGGGSDAWRGKAALMFLCAICIWSPIAKTATAKEADFDCTLQETCKEPAKCEAVLSLGFSDIALNTLHTSLGTFEVLAKSEPGTKLDEIQLSTQTYQIVTTGGFVQAHQETQKQTLTLTLAQTDNATVYGTLITVPAKYADYDNARRVFAGPCELGF